MLLKKSTIVRILILSNCSSFYSKKCKNKVRFVNNQINGSFSAGCAGYHNPGDVRATPRGCDTPVRLAGAAVTCSVAHT